MLGDNFKYMNGSIYSGTKDSSSVWQAEKLAEGVNIIKASALTGGILLSIAFTDDPLIEPALWPTISSQDPKYWTATGAYVAWKSVGIGTFNLEQSVAR